MGRPHMLLLVGAVMATVSLTSQMSLPPVAEFAKVSPPTISPPPRGIYPPPQLSDIEGEWPLYVKVYEWLVNNGYCEKLESVEKLTLEELKAYVKPSVIEMKRFYFNKTKSEGKTLTDELTHEVLDLMSLPRCSRPDNKNLISDEKDSGKDKDHTRKRRWARLGNTLWGDSNMPLKIKFKNYLSSMDKRDQEKAARHCADLWEKHSSLRFELVSSSASFGHIEVQFLYIDGPWNTVGKGLSPVPYRRPPSSYLRLDNGESWKASAKDSGYGVSLIWAMCHEMGHNLGLSHSNDRKAIMYPSGVGQSEDRLGADDIKGISTLYPSRNKPRPSPPTPKPQPPTPKPQPPPPTTRPRPPPTTTRPRPPPTTTRPRPPPTTTRPRPPPTTTRPRPPPTTTRPRPPPTTTRPRPPPTTTRPRPHPTTPSRHPQPSRRQPQRYRPRPRTYPRPYPRPYQRWPYSQRYIPRVYAHQAREPRFPPPGHKPRYRPVGLAIVTEPTLDSPLPNVIF